MFIPEGIGSHFEEVFISKVVEVEQGLRTAGHRIEAQTEYRRVMTGGVSNPADCGGDERRCGRSSAGSMQHYT
jgi:hypothetical protein